MSLFIFSSWRLYLVAEIVSDLLVVAPLAATAIWLLCDTRAKDQVGWPMVVSIGIVFFVTALLKLLLPSPRPINAYFPALSQFDSFPSRHTALSFALAFSILPKFKKFGAVLLVVAVLVGVSRILLLAHRPLDVLVGAVIGYGAAVVGRRRLKNCKGR